MTGYSVSNARLREGIWQGLLVAPEGVATLPEVALLHLGAPLDGLKLVPDADVAGLWSLSVPIPASLISDGVQTFVLRETASGEVLARFAIAAGAPLEDDLRCEVELLRAELDLLKRAFRRHCMETGGG